MKRIHTVAAAMGALLLGCQDPDLPTAPPRTPGLTAAMGSAALKAPSNASARASSPVQIDLNWQDNSSNETGFEVYRSTSGASGTFTLRGTTSANLTSYGDNGLNSSTQYCYKVRVVRLYDGKTGYSEFSNTACATTLAPPPPPPPPTPDAPSGLIAVASGSSSVSVSWTDNSTTETGFELHRSASGQPGTFSILAGLGANVSSYGNAGLAPLTQYCYQVRAMQVSASTTLYSAFSNTACATTPAPPPPPPPSPPAAASGTVAHASSYLGVFVSWTDNATNEDGFRVYRSIDGGGVWNLAATVGANSGNWTEYAVAEQPVCYRVAAFDVSGEATPSSSACTVQPAAPTNLTVTRLDSATVELIWDDNSVVEHGYEVWVSWYRGSYYCYPVGYHGEKDAGTYEGEGVWAVLPANSTTYRAALSSEPDCDPPTIYWFFVVAVRGS